MCYQPITIKTPQGYRTVPCGKCLECLRKYQSDWSNRMYEELKAHDGKAVFFTLTYDEQNVPKNYLYDYRVYRSASDYGYDNTYVDEKGKEKVRVRGERRHKRQVPYKELQELGLDTDRIIDFNVRRDNHAQFMDSIKKLYADYMGFIADVTSNQSEYKSDVYDFDEFEGDLYEFDQQMVKVMEDDDYMEVDMTGYRERPIMMFNSVRKKDVQDWIKRARQRREREAKRTKAPKKEFSFFITSEYGPRTLRPHYHGVLFGVTAEETMDMVNDWQRHHGRRISWADVDLSKGDMSYAAKYCSKGFYEHPLCSRDFFYPRPLVGGETDLRPFTEYHSKHYERCIELFGIDEPIVDPTFHLVSKGLGEDWVESHTYLTEDFQDLDFKESDVAATIRVVRASEWHGEMESEMIYVPEERIPGIRREFKETKSKDYAECLERLFDRFKYHRTFKGEDFTYGVPKYYRAKVFGDGLRAAFANYVQQLNVEVYQEKLEQLRAGNPGWSDAQIVSEMEKQDQRDRFDRMRNVRQRLERQYNKSKL